MFEFHPYDVESLLESIIATLYLIESGAAAETSMVGRLSCECRAVVKKETSRLANWTN